MDFIDKILHFFIYKVFRLKLSEGKYVALVEFVKFGIVGLSNTVISYVIYLLVLFACDKANFMVKYDYLLAPILNLLISVPVNFLLNKFWAFKKG